LSSLTNSAAHRLTDTLQGGPNIQTSLRHLT